MTLSRFYASLCPKEKQFVDDARSLMQNHFTQHDLQVNFKIFKIYAQSVLQLLSIQEKTTSALATLQHQSGNSSGCLPQLELVPLPLTEQIPSLVDLKACLGERTQLQDTHYLVQALLDATRTVYEMRFQHLITDQQSAPPPPGKEEFVPR